LVLARLPLLSSNLMITMPRTRRTPAPTMVCPQMTEKQKRLFELRLKMVR
jgi:hypothetical protein